MEEIFSNGNDSLDFEENYLTRGFEGFLIKLQLYFKMAVFKNMLTGLQREVEHCHADEEVHRVPSRIAAVFSLNAELNCGRYRSPVIVPSG